MGLDPPVLCIPGGTGGVSLSTGRVGGEAGPTCEFLSIFHLLSVVWASKAEWLGLTWEMKDIHGGGGHMGHAQNIIRDACAPHTCRPYLQFPQQLRLTTGLQVLQGLPKHTPDALLVGRASRGAVTQEPDSISSWWVGGRAKGGLRSLRGSGPSDEVPRGGGRAGKRAGRQVGLLGGTAGALGAVGGDTEWEGSGGREDAVRVTRTGGSQLEQGQMRRGGVR